MDVRRYVSRRIAGAYFLFAAAWIGISDLALIELTKDLPTFAGASLIKGGAFVLITTALLYWFISHQLRNAATSLPFVPEAVAPRLARLNPTFIFGAMAVLAIAFVVAMFSRESDNHREMARNNLRAIAELKADQIELLLSQRQATARSYGQSRGMRDDMTRLAQSPDPKILAAIKNRIEELRRDQEFDAVLMLDAAGQLVAAAGSERLRQLSPALVAQAVRSMESRTPVANYLHRETQQPGAPILIDYITPLPSASGSPEMVGAIVLRENASNRLFRLIQDWPVPSATAESLLVRRDGDDVLYLNDLRHAKDTAFRLRKSLSETGIPAVRAVRANTSVLLDGKDYRGTSVVAASRGIAGTDWFLIAKIDRDEVLAPVRQSTLIWLGSILCMTLLSAAGIAIMWRQQLRLVAANELAEAAGRIRAEGKLSEAEERYRALFERSLDCVFLADLDGNFLDANHAALDLLGYRREEIPSINYRTLTHPEDLARVYASLQDVIRSGTQRTPQEYRLRAKDGREIVAEVRSSVVYDEGTPSAILGIARDVTGRKLADEKIRRLNRVYALLSGINTLIVHVSDREALFDGACRIAIEHGKFEMAWIGLFDPATEDVTPVAWAGASAEEITRDKSSGREDSPRGKGGVGRAIRGRQPVFNNDIAANPSGGPRVEKILKLGFRSQITLPVFEGQAIVATLTMYAREPDFFDEEEVRLLTELAGDISFALQNLAGEQARRRIDAALREAEQRFRALVETSSDWIWQVDARGVYTYASPKVREILGYVPEEVVGKTPFDFMPPDEAQRAGRLFADLAATRQPFERLENANLHKDGHRVILETSGVALVDEHGTYLGYRGVDRDITERKRAEDTLHESEQRFRAMIEQSISGFYMIQDDRFTYVNSRFAEVFGYASADEIVGKRPSELIAPKDRATVAANIQRRLEGKVKSVSYSFAGQRKDGTEVEVGVHGSLATYQGHPVIMGLLQDISERKHAEEEIKRYVARLEQAMQSTINVVATIGELRDPYTHGHERRVGEIAAAIATEMGLDENQVEGIRIAGYLHDVGKIGVPAEILSKPAKLSKVEFELVKDHARQGYEILKTVQFPWPVAEAAWQHHERIDGSGYPRGLKGEEIILEARVLAVADAMEAMSSHRPYRPRLDLDKALAEVEKYRGTLYWPQAADACLRLFRDKGYELPV